MEATGFLRTIEIVAAVITGVVTLLTILVSLAFWKSISDAEGRRADSINARLRASKAR